MQSPSLMDHQQFGHLILVEVYSSDVQVYVTFILNRALSGLGGGPALVVSGGKRGVAGWFQSE